MHLRSRLPTHTHTATHTVSHTWQLPNRQAWPGTPPAVAHPSHAVTWWAELHTGPESQVCRVSPTRTHTQLHAPEVSHKHPRHGPPHASRSGTHRPSGSRLADTPAEPSHTGADPGTVELHTSHLPRRTQSTHAPSHTKTDVPTCSNSRAKAARVRHVPTDGDPWGRTHEVTRTGARAQSSGVTGAHTHGDTCRTRLHRDKRPRVARGAGEDVPGTHRQRGTRTTAARAHTAPRRPRLGTSFEGLGGSRQAWRVRVSFSTVSGPTWSTRTPCDPSSRGGADMQASRSKAAASTVGPKSRADPLCARAPGDLRPVWGSQELQLPEGAALRPHSD